MKKSFFFATMLLSIATTAQQRTFVKSVGANYAAKQVTFNISWAAGSRGTVGANTYNSKVWVLVDYQEVQNGVTVGSWKRADINLSSLPAGCTADGTNTKGFWYQGQTSAAQNASITVTLSGAPDKFNWCAFVSDCSPRVIASSNGSYTFAGTPPFVLTATNGATQQVNGTTLAHSALNITPTYITDQTNCPGIFCPYTGTDLFIDATHICQQRTSGAKNWEAWIKDTRDNELYRIVHMPDNKWWLAQNVKYAGTGAVNTRSGCTKDKCGRLYSGAQMNSAQGGTSGTGANKQGICPGGWVLPLVSDFRQMVDVIDKITYFVSGNGYITGVSSTINQRLGCLAPAGYSPNDYYGWANEMASWTNMPSTTAGHEGWRSNDANNCDWSLLLKHYAGGGVSDDRAYLALQCSSLDRVAPVRCWRVL